MDLGVYSWIDENVQKLYLPLPFYESLPFCEYYMLASGNSLALNQGIQEEQVVPAGKYEIEKFNGKNDFSYQRMQMKNLLISQKLHNALAGKEQKPEDIKDEDWEKLDLEARAAVILCLERDVAFLGE